MQDGLGACLTAAQTFPGLVKGLTEIVLPNAAMSACIALTIMIISQSLYGDFLPAAKEICGVQPQITDEMKLTFWNEVLPQVYGDLLEMYGDKEGRSRMGLGVNESLSTTWLALLRENKEYDGNDILRWAQALTPEQCAQAVQAIIQTEPKQQKINDEAIVETIMNRSGMEKTLETWRDKKGNGLLGRASTFGRGNTTSPSV